MTTDVLVVGAGPTGLVIALWLAALGVRVRIIDKTAEPGTTSRALAVQVRTLELYDHLGLARDVIERGRRFVAANLWVRGTKAGRVAFGDVGMGLSPFPYALIFPQDEPERVLIAQLAARGVEVERGTTLIDLEDRGDHVSARLRRADGFVEGRAFLLGDAAHIHSPVGGQGMNTGIGDAVNLAWKFAAVLQRQAPPAILETYEPERIGFARRLVATTDRAFTLVTSRGRLARVVRVHVVPRVLPVLFRSRLVRRLMFRTVSQTRVRYRESPLSVGRAGTVHGGDRLPWVGDNFGPLSSLAWQTHVYGEPSGGVRKACASRGLALHVFPWHRPMRRAGLARDALYLVRPDGYVALADRDASADALERYLDRHGIRLTPAAQ